MDSPNKMPVMWKVFPCHNANMDIHTSRELINHIKGYRQTPQPQQEPATLWHLQMRNLQFLERVLAMQYYETQNAEL